MASASLSIRPLTDEERAAVAEWRYPGRYATYDFDEGSQGPDDEVFAVVDADGELIGCCCFGADARIPEVDEVPGVVDVGYAMRPDLMGRGRGRDHLTAVLAFAAGRYRPERFRALVLGWNERSLATCRGAGFAVTGAVRGADGDFVVLERPATLDMRTRGKLDSGSTTSSSPRSGRSSSGGPSRRGSHDPHPPDQRAGR